MAQLAALILAAGRSTRFGPANKLLAPVNGEPVLATTLGLFDSEFFDAHILVVDTNAPATAALAPPHFRIVRNPRSGDGMGVSLALGVREVTKVKDLKGVIIALGDMPYVSPATIASLIIHAANEPTHIIAPRMNGKIGHPVIFPERFFAALTALTGDKGARSLILDNNDALTLVDVEDDGVLRDIDRPSDLS